MKRPGIARAMPGGRCGGAAARASRPASLLSLALFTLLFVSGCGGGEDGPPQGETRERRGGGHGPGGRPDMPAVAVAVEPATRGAISTYYSATATLDPNKQAEIPARVSGVILDLLVEEGDLVRKGAPLLRIEDDEYRHRFSQADAEAAKERARFDRTQKMFDGDLISAEEFEGARSDLRSAEADRDLAALELSHTEVRAPFTGKIVQRFIDPGQMVSDGTVLFTIADVGRLLARVHVPAKEFRGIRADQTVELLVDSGGDVLTGRIILVSPVIDATSGTIKVTVEIADPPDNIRPGDFAEVRIVTDLHQGAILVSKNAVVSERGERVVYVAADSVAERRAVEVGFEDNESAEIAGGVAEGELVVIQGQRSLRDGQPIKILDALPFETGDRAREGS